MGNEKLKGINPFVVKRKVEDGGALPGVAKSLGDNLSSGSGSIENTGVGTGFSEKRYYTPSLVQKGNYSRRDWVDALFDKAQETNDPVQREILMKAYNDLKTGIHYD